MSGYCWLNEWVPLDDAHLVEQFAKSPEDFRDQYRFTLAQYRFTLARARDAEAKLERHRSAFRALNAALREVQ